MALPKEFIPDVRLTRSKDGSNGTATFYFDYPQALSEDGVEVTGMYLVDEEGELVTREVKGKFINGEPAGYRSNLCDEKCRRLGPLYALYESLCRAKRPGIYQELETATTP